MMSRSNSNEIDDAGEPSSYQHMEESFSKVAGNQTVPDHAEGSPEATKAGFEGKLSGDESGQAAITDSDRKWLQQPQYTPSSFATSASIPATSHALPYTGEAAATSIPNQTEVAVAAIKPLHQASSASLLPSASSGSLCSSSELKNPPGSAGSAKASPYMTQSSLLDASGGSSVVAAVAAAAAASMTASAGGDIPASTLPLAIHATMPPTERSTKSKGGSLRRGKWTAEEEAYVARVIQDFNSGFLNAPAGTTLRSYLSDKLRCDPMRITKKFTGESCIGKRVFHPAVRSPANANTIDKAQAELDALEKRWRRRLEMQQRESAKKAAASAAAANAATTGSSAMVQGVPVAILGAGAHGANDSQIQQTAVTQAASWLDRANAILKGSISTDAAMNSSTHTSTSSSPQPRDESTQSSGDDSLENQMIEVQRLIYEGPAIQQTAAAFPNLLIQSSNSSDHGRSSPGTAARPSVALSTDASGMVAPDSEPADKRLRTSNTSAGPETGDAEAFVGFLSSVRASAAAGHDL